MKLTIQGISPGLKKGRGNPPCWGEAMYVACDILSSLSPLRVRGIDDILWLRQKRLTENVLANNALLNRLSSSR